MNPAMPVQHIGLSEVLSALSSAFDLTEGQAQGHAARACLIGMRLAETLELDPDTRSALYYALLLKDAGSSGNSSHAAALFGSDDHAVKRQLKLVDWTRFGEAALYSIRSAAIGQPLAARVRQIAKVARAGRTAVRELVRVRCERGAEIALGLGFPRATAEVIRSLDEHWDGRGLPDGLRGSEIPLLARIAGLAQTVDVFATISGAGAAMDIARRRRGTWFDPDLVDALLSWPDDRAWWEGPRGQEAVRRAVAAEPLERVRRVDEAGLDGVAEAVAQIIDVKTPFTFRHSSRVAAYARGIAGELGFSEAEGHRLGRAGLLHDLGKLSVSNRILEKSASLTEDEWARVKRHPVVTWEILSRAKVFGEFARTAALHHERLDGSGYPWHLNARDIDLAAGILAVADTFDAMTSWRPYCAPVPADTAVFLLQRESGSRFDAEAVAGLGTYLQQQGYALPPADLGMEPEPAEIPALKIRDAVSALGKGNRPAPPVPGSQIGTERI